MTEDSLAKIDAVRFALEQAATVQEIKHVIDLTKAAETYARQTKAGNEIQLKVAEYIVRAERKLGEILQAAKAAGQIDKTRSLKKGSVVVGDDHGGFTLDEAGISKDLSSRAQKLAGIPDNTFEEEITNERASGTVSSKRVIKAGSNGEKPRSNKPPKEHKAAPEVIDLRDKGLTNPEIAKQTGIHPRMVRKIVEHDNLRRSGEPQITPDMLSMSAQQKLDTAIKQYRKKLDREFDAAVLAEGRRYLERVTPSLLKREHQADRIIRMRKGFMTRATYVLILSCLHPDWVTDEKQKDRYANAFREFTKLEKLLLDEKESPTDIPRMPTTAAEWQEAKRQATEARKAKRQKSDLARR
jgi:hypothetical protein